MMDKIVTIPQKIVDWLNIQPSLKDVTFFTEFPPIMKSVPLKKAIVAVGIEELNIVDKFVANDNGVLEKQEYCRTANIKTRLSICVPYSHGGSAKDVTFFTEFPPIMKSVPLKKAIVAVGIEELNIVDKFVANDNGVLEKQEYCRTANIKTRLSICVPYSHGGSACHDHFTKIIDALTFRTDLNIEESGCGETESDRDTSALVCHGWFKIVADFCPAESIDENFTSFLSKDFICSGHVTNDEIHVTNEDKELWNNAVKTGHYTGTGQSSTTVNLDFTPKLLIVFCTEFPATTVDFDSKTATSHIGFASGDFASAGLSLTSSGFKITKSTVNGIVSFFNELGYTYSYIALR